VRSRLLLGAAVLMMLVPSFMFWAGPLRRPLMVAGDRLEERACLVCKGSNPDCKRCRGKGVLEYIVPGPQRPTHIIGHVYANDQPVESAHVTILTSVEPITLRTDPAGRFGATLPPGNYTVVLKKAEGTPESRHELSVAALTEPVPSDDQVTFPTQDRGFNLPK